MGKVHLGIEAKQGWLSQLFGGGMSVERAAYEVGKRLAEQPDEPIDPLYPHLPAEVQPPPAKGKTLAVELKPVSLDSETAAQGLTFGLAALLLMATSVGLLTLTLVTANTNRPFPPNLPPQETVWGLGATTGASWLLFLFVLRKLTNRPRGRPTPLEISTHPVFQGETVRLRAVQRGPLVLDQPLEVLLLCEEVAGYSHGTQVRSHRGIVFSQVVARGQMLEMRGMVAEELLFEFAIPIGRMHTLAAGLNSVVWRLRIQGKAKRGHAFWREYQLIVRPPRAVVPTLAFRPGVEP